MIRVGLHGFDSPLLTPQCAPGSASQRACLDLRPVDIVGDLAGALDSSTVDLVVTRLRKPADVAALTAFLGTGPGVPLAATAGPDLLDQLELAPLFAAGLAGLLLDPIDGRDVEELATKLLGGTPPDRSRAVRRIIPLGPPPAATTPATPCSATAQPANAVPGSATSPAGQRPAPPHDQVPPTDRASSPAAAPASSGATNAAEPARTGDRTGDRTDHPGADRDARRLRVLVVEDDDVIGQLMADLFEAHGESIALVPTCAAALARLNDRWDLVIVDNHLPDGSGQDVIERAIQRQAHAVIVQVSGSIGRADSPVRSLLKPISRTDVRELLAAAAIARAR